MKVYVKLLEETYNNSTSQIKIDKLSGKFCIQKGDRLEDNLLTKIIQHKELNHKILTASTFCNKCNTNLHGIKLTLISLQQ